jgi:hypothetical protein
LGQKTGYEALNIWVLEMRVGVKLSVLIPFKRGPSVFRVWIHLLENSDALTFPVSWI